MIRKFVPLILFVLLCLAGAKAQDTPAQDPNAEVKDLLQAAYDRSDAALAQKDDDEVLAIYTDDIQLIDMKGKVWLKGKLALSRQLADFEAEATLKVPIHEIKSVVLNGDTAIATVRSNVAVKGRTASQWMVARDFWVKSGDEWKIKRHRQITR